MDGLEARQYAIGKMPNTADLAKLWADSNVFHVSAVRRNRGTTVWRQADVA
jgi:hypothetical protein